jgi:hypothetical protein
VESFIAAASSGFAANGVPANIRPAKSEDPPTDEKMPDTAGEM